MNQNPEQNKTVFTNALDTKNYNNEDKTASAPNPPKFLYYSEDVGSPKRPQQPAPSQAPNNPAPDAETPDEKKKKNVPLIIAIIAAVVIVLAAAGFFVYAFFFSGNGNNAKAEKPAHSATQDSAPSQQITENKIEKTVRIPSVIGWSEEEARKELNKAGFTDIVTKREFTNDAAVNHVFKQSPDPETEVSTKQKITLTIAKEGSEKPYVESTTAAQDDSDDYIFPESDSRNLTAEDIEPYRGDSEKIQRAINEIYARHGAVFDKDEDNAYFETKAWYQEISLKRPKSEIDAEEFNQYENKNIGFLTKYL